MGQLSSSSGRLQIHLQYQIHQYLAHTLLSAIEITATQHREKNKTQRKKQRWKEKHR